MLDHFPEIGSGPPADRLNTLMTGPLIALIAKLLTGASARWVDCQPDTCQRVYFANHTSHLDSLVIWSALPGPIRSLTRPVAAKDYWLALFELVKVFEKSVIPGLMAKV